MDEQKPSKSSAAWVRTAVDYGAPIAFAVAYFTTKNFQTATWVLVAASAAALAPSLSESARNALKNDLLGRAQAVAQAAGGLLGLGNKISTSERAVLDELGEAFG